MDDSIDRLAAACTEFDHEGFTVPSRGGFSYAKPVTGLIEWMPVLQHGKSVTVKMVTYHPTNPQKQRLPTILSSVLVFDTETGHLTGIVDGTFLTALRTGAASAVASRVLAQPTSSTLGLIGCGAQAVTQLHALARVFPIRKVLLHDVDPAAVRSFTRRVRYLYLDNISFAEASVEDIVSESDIVCTCTSVEVGSGAVFPDLNSKPHLHVNAVGSDFPGKTELPRSLLKRSLVCPDFREQAVAEGECQQLLDSEIGPDLVELTSAAEDYAPYRDCPTVFDSTGWALEDHVVADMLLRHAAKLGVGSNVVLESVSADPKDPYGFALDDLYVAASKRIASE
jgi:ornithine cyclodeaminase/alanine dehydrogenase-like protein (mu-crystallin family)